MKIEQIYTKCLAQGSYYIESNGEAVVIDPLREPFQYLHLANESGATIKYIFETHFHADFVSGHVTLAKETGAPIVFGPNANPTYETIIAKDNQAFNVGNITIKVLHTPGHTMESSTYLLIDENGKEHAIFSGDTLFLGDVGRPDLAQKGADMTQEELAGTLFDSLRNKIMPLPNDVIIYPGHGAGSACGKSMSKETVGVLGEQKETNYALRADMTKEEFIKEVTDGLAPPPAYFPLNVQLNKNGYDNLEEIINKGSKGLSADEFETAAQETGAIVLDVRHQKDFSAGHIPGALFIGIDGGFAPWVGAIIKDVKQPILLITPEGRLEETITRLARVGFDNVLGHLAGGFDTWELGGKLIDTVDNITAEDFAVKSNETELSVFDVRKDGEFKSEHIKNAEHTPLSKLSDYIAQYPTDKPNFVHCAGGYRSVIAISILKAQGIHNLVDVLGGYGAIKKTNMETTSFVCHSSL